MPSRVTALVTFGANGVITGVMRWWGAGRSRAIHVGAESTAKPRHEVLMKALLTWKAAFEPLSSGNAVPLLLLAAVAVAAAGCSSSPSADAVAPPLDAGASIEGGTRVDASPRDASDGDAFAHASPNDGGADVDAVAHALDGADGATLTSMCPNGIAVQILCPQGAAPCNDAGETTCTGVDCTCCSDLVISYTAAVPAACQSTPTCECLAEALLDVSPDSGTGEPPIECGECTVTEPLE